MGSLKFSGSLKVSIPQEHSILPSYRNSLYHRIFPQLLIFSTSTISSIDLDCQFQQIFVILPFGKTKEL